MFKKLLLAVVLLNTLVFSKEIVVVIDRSSVNELPNKKIEKNIDKIFEFEKKHPDQYFLRDGDVISSYTINSDITKLSPTAFENYVFENLKSNREEMFEKPFRVKVNGKRKKYRGRSNLVKSELYGVKKVTKNNLVLCIDVSGSMLKDKKKNAKDAHLAALEIIKVIDPKYTQVAIIQFGYQAEVVQDFTSDKALLEDQVGKVIAGIKNNTPTNTKDGIDRATSMLEGKVGGKQIILLSDGSPQVYNAKKKLVSLVDETVASAQKAKKAKIEVLSIALQGADINTLNKISTLGLSLEATSNKFQKMLKLSMVSDSPIIDSLRYIYENENITNKEEERVLIIFSDMMEKTQTFNFNTVNDISDRNFMDKVLSHSQLPNMKGVEVYVTGFSEKQTPEHLEKLKVFWKAFFEKSGAKLISFSPALSLKK